MALYEVEAPNGSVYEIEGPDDATDEQIAAYAQEQFGSKQQPPAAPAPAPSKANDPTVGGTFRPAGFDTGVGMPAWLERGLAGTGMGMARVGRGVGQAVGAVDQSEIDAAHDAERALGDTTAGKVGNVLGTAAAFAPAAFVPGANTLAGAAATGLVGGALATEGGLKERAVGGLGGAVGGPAGILAGRALGAGAKALGTKAAKTEDAGTREAIRSAQEAGFRLPPSEMARSAPGRAVAQTAEWFSGRQAVPAKFSSFNQRRANELVRGDLDLKGKGQITEADILAAKRPHLAIYKEAEQIGKDAKFAVEQWRTTNDELRQVYKIQNRNPTLDGKKEIERLTADANSWLTALEAEATKAGKPVVVQRLANARRELGKIGTAENAINERGDVVAKSLSSALDRNVPLSGGMLKVAKFAGAFPQFAQKSTQAGWMSGSPPLATSLGSGGAFYMGEPVTAATLLAGPYLTRAGLMSRPAQALARPSANPGQLRINVGKMLETEEGRRALSSAGIASAMLANQQ